MLGGLGVWKVWKVLEGFIMGRKVLGQTMHLPLLTVLTPGTCDKSLQHRSCVTARGFDLAAQDPLAMLPI